MSDTVTSRPSGTGWIPWVAALLGFGFQVIWFSSQFGSLSARIAEAERRVQTIEQNGSPVVQAIRTEVSINSRRISNLEDQYSSKVTGLLTDNSAHNESLRRMHADLTSLQDWRLVRTREEGDLVGRLAILDRQLQQLQADHVSLARELAAQAVVVKSVAAPRSR